MKLLIGLVYFMALMTGFVCGEVTRGVVVTIKPLHSLVSGVIGETGEATLLLESNTSPHDFQLKPSQLRSIHKAKVIFYIDNKFETFLTSALRTIPEHIRVRPLMNVHDLNFHSQRLGGAWESHDECHVHHKDGEECEKHEKNAKDNADMHIWLDPNNAIKLVRYVAVELGELYPENKSIYLKNANEYISKIINLNQELKNMMSGLENKSFIVFHDAYQYFEKAYNLKAVGSITLEPDESPSPKRIKEIRHKLIESEVKCVFREPQFSDRLVNVAIEGSSAKSGTLDPLGTDLMVGEGLYLELLKNLGLSLKQGLN